MSDSRKTLVIEHAEQLWRVETRRDFLKMLGVGGTIVMLPSLFAACKSDKAVAPPAGPQAVALNLSNDFGILNYAYALEQLEAAFYIAVVASTPFGTMSAEQKEVFTDLRAHEVVHREFLRKALGTNAIPDLTLNTAAVATTLTNIPTILKNAEAFEDLGVSAYNGAGKYLKDAGYLTIAGKIVSVEARHAAAIRDMREGLNLAGTAAGTRFAGDDVVLTSGTFAGLDVKLEPGAVLARVGATTLVSNAVSIGTPPDAAITAKQTPDQGPPNPTP
ncbi:MAG: ferritin-like domain-containing protein [Gemmatimonadaceae bacterium]